MRVIAGSRRGTVLKAPPGMGTRPTTDRTKETLFNMLMPYIAQAKVLDLFSGSGAIAIEALSRGAKRASLVERDRQALRVIDENLKKTRFEQQARVLAIDVFDALVRLKRQGESFDLIFMDPPYGHELERQVLEKLSGSSLLARDALVVVEASIETSFEYLSEYGFWMKKQKRYKTNQHLFLQYESDVP